MTAAMMLVFVTVMPAMAWSMVYTAAFFVGPFFGSVAAFIYFCYSGTTVTQFAHIAEDAPGKFSAFASDLGFMVGAWPERLDIPQLKGNGMPFMRSTKKIDADGDLEYVRYNQANGSQTLIIFND